MSHPILNGKEGDIHLLLGNEAIVRGAIEAGIQVVTCYPGTPSSEVPDTFFRLSPGADYKFEYSTNEKVALEVGGGATLGGALTMTTMKHVGVNVAADALMTLAYIGTPGGLVLLSADDPGCHSSQNEQDNRIFARFAGLPVFEPTTAQEAKDMTKAALLYSRKWQQPVMLRTTTRLNHLRGPVTLGPVEPVELVEPEKNPRRFVPIPAVARVRHKAMVENLETIAKDMAATEWNTISGEGKIGVITSGISRAYVHDAVAEHNLGKEVKVLELGFSNPLPEQTIRSFLEGLDKVLFMEEGEPVLEQEVRAMCQAEGISIEILGKEFARLSIFGEYDTAMATEAIFKALGKDESLPEPCQPEGPLPMRPPNLCAGCPHRAAYFAVRQTFGDNAFYSSDIGCYTLGILPPLSAADFLLCMGSSVSAGSGFSMANGKQVVAFIGDSTFFHSGITGLVNAVFNNHDLILVILDNHTTAMTGHQPHPGVELTIHGDNSCRVDIESVVRGCGVDQIKKVNPLNLKSTKAALEEMKEQSGVRVLIAREPCPLHSRRLLKKTAPMVAYVANQSDEVKKCLDTLACPAFSMKDGEVVIDDASCSGCMFCLQLTKDIKTRKRG